MSLVGFFGCLFFFVFKKIVPIFSPNGRPLIVLTLASQHMHESHMHDIP